MATAKTSPAKASSAKTSSAKAAPANPRTSAKPAEKTDAAAVADTRADTPVAAVPAEGGAPALRVKPPAMKIKDLVTRVTEATGGKKKGVKEVVEATLAALGDALSKGEEMNLPGFGRARIAKATEKDGASTLTLKLRRGAHRKKDAKEPLAEDEDDG